MHSIESMIDDAVEKIMTSFSIDDNSMNIRVLEDILIPLTMGAVKKFNSYMVTDKPLDENLGKDINLKV